MLKMGIVGLPNAGKSTLFNALARGHADVASHPFTTVEPNVGEALVPDPRLPRLAEVMRAERVVPAHVRFVDIAGLVRGAHRGEGLGNRFLGHIREVDALMIVVRAFESAAAPHPEGDVDPARDLATLQTELALADLETLTSAVDREERRAASMHDEAGRERAAAMRNAVAVLDRDEPVRAGLAADDLARLRDFSLLTAKPVLVVVNVGEEDIGGALDRLRPALPPEVDVVAVSARIEQEVEDLSEGDARELLAAYGIEQRGTAAIADAARRLLRLITFYSVESAETRAWLIPEGTTAVGAAGEIHTDMAAGFIRADVVPANALIEAGSVAAARERGVLRSEGRDYVVRDGDVLTFRFRS